MSLLKRLETKQERSTLGTSKKAQAVDPEKAIKQQIHQAIVAEVTQELLSDASREDELKSQIVDIAGRVMSDSGLLITRQDKQRIIAQLGDEVLGFGPITSLLHDVDVSKIMVNGPERVYVERKGRLELSEVVFRDDEHVL